MNRNTVGVVGGGAAGMMAAITAARQGASVTILEQGERVGKKLLMTGNGKCNLGNLCLDADMYYGGSREWIQSALNCFGVEDTVRFFRELGLLIKNKNGYLYPACEQASVVLDVLRNELKVLGVEIVTECKINQIEKRPIENTDRKDTDRNGTDTNNPDKDEAGKIILSDGKRQFAFDAVVLACGGKAAPKTGSDGSGYKLAKQLGHRLIPAVPALVQLRCRENYLKAVAGVRAEGRILVWKDGECVAQETGEIQFTDYGISGIPVFQVSRVVNYLLREKEEVEVTLNLLPEYKDADFSTLCVSRSLLQSDRTVEEFFTGMLNKKLMTLFMKMAGLKLATPVEDAEPFLLERVYGLCRNWKLHVTGSNPYDNAQVCAGGVDVAQVTEHMESVLCPGVYLAGELLDVDGKCGGYNLQWAWSSGYLAGKAAGKDSRR